MNHFRRLTLATATIGLLTACASAPTPQDLDAQAVAMMKAAFRDEGIAKADRITQDAVQQACSGEQPPSKELAAKVEAEALASVRWPRRPARCRSRLNRRPRTASSC